MVNLLSSKQVILVRFQLLVLADSIIAVPLEPLTKYVVFVEANFKCAIMIKYSDMNYLPTTFHVYYG